ncbi:MipA/OmpV family protein [Pigmentiphaga aceris]|uniref:MipA/OmpV family protein n=1 Tax=Pigmentiphaga aceris TaxID=1940612 RepID=A0A5C0B2J7_9BURK|nr:MipA/OmpV family protein [Pigmentiphaga aceris]QEI07933.1 MipA/OmpV family protein [Pigmentiphaga aceris]
MPNTASLSAVLSAMLMVTVLPTAFAQSTVQSTAQTAPPASTSDSFFGLGVGVSTDRSPYTGVGYENHLIPVVSYESRLFSIQGKTADVHLLGDERLSFSARAEYGFGDGYKGSDAPALNGMSHRKESIWLGGVVEWDAGWADLTASWLGDASGRSKGQQVGLGLERDFPMGQWLLTPRIGAIWQDSKFVDYYYGVRSSEARPGRAAYAGKSAISTELGVRAQYSLTPKQTVFLDLSANRVGSSIQDSPIVDRTWLPAVRAGYLYRFN